MHGPACPEPTSNATTGGVAAGEAGQATVAALIGASVGAGIALLLLAAALVLLAMRYRKDHKQLGVFQRFFSSADILHEVREKRLAGRAIAPSS